MTETIDRQTDEGRNRVAGFYWVSSSPEWIIAKYVPARDEEVWHDPHWLLPGVDEWQYDKDLVIDEHRIIRHG